METMNQAQDMDVFSSVPVQTSITGEEEINFYSINPLDSVQPIQFDITPSYTAMTDPAIMLYTTCKIVNGDGSILKDAAKVAPTNLTVHSLFRSVVVKLNGVTVNQATGTYSYRAYIETNYTYSTQGKNAAVGHLQMYQQEKAGSFNSTTATQNPSYDYRQDKFKKSASVQMASRLHCDIFLQRKLIVPGVSISITLEQANDAFRVFSGETTPDQKIIIKRAILKVRRVNLTPSYLLNLERAMLTSPARYPIAHSTVRTTQLTAMQSQLSNFMVYNGQIPRLVIITACPTAAMQGHYPSNPYEFSLLNAATVQLECNGILYPNQPYSPKISWIEPYINNLKIINKLFADIDNGFQIDDFIPNGHQALAFDLSATDSGTADYTSPKRNGLLTLTANWETGAIPVNTTLIMYLQWDSEIAIDGRKNIILNYIP